MTVKRLGELFFIGFWGAAILVLGIGTANAGVILENPQSCMVTDVTAGAPANKNADACIGLILKSGGGQPQPNDSPTLLNNALVGTNAATIWDANGAFGINTWTFIGKDQQSSNVFIDVTSGNPGTWTTTSPLIAGTSYLFAAKQSTQLALYLFTGLGGVSGGTVDMNAIFGDGFTDDGWSHFSIYSSDPSTPFFPVPEPGALSLLGLGLLGLGLSRRRQKR